MAKVFKPNITVKGQVGDYVENSVTHENDTQYEVWSYDHWSGDATITIDIGKKHKLATNPTKGVVTDYGTAPGVLIVEYSPKSEVTLYERYTNFGNNDVIINYDLIRTYDVYSLKNGKKIGTWILHNGSIDKSRGDELYLKFDDDPRDSIQYLSTGQLQDNYHSGLFPPLTHLLTKKEIEAVEGLVERLSKLGERGPIYANDAAGALAEALKSARSSPMYDSVKDVFDLAEENLWEDEYITPRELAWMASFRAGLDGDKWKHTWNQVKTALSQFPDYDPVMKTARDGYDHGRDLKEYWKNVGDFDI